MTSPFASAHHPSHLAYLGETAISKLVEGFVEVARSEKAIPSDGLRVGEGSVTENAKRGTTNGNPVCVEVMASEKTRNHRDGDEAASPESEMANHVSYV
jgi:hypothetical protein